jgi:hypothetical protein
MKAMERFFKIVTSPLRGAEENRQSRERSVRYSNTRHEALCKNKVATLHEMFQAWLRWNKVETGLRAARSGGRRKSRRRDRREEAMLEEKTWVSIARLEIESNLNNNALAPGLLHCYRPSAPITPCKPAVGTPRPAPLGILTPEAVADKPGEAAARDYSCSGVADVRVPVSCFWQCSVGFDAGMTIVSICQWSTINIAARFFIIIFTWLLNLYLNLLFLQLFIDHSFFPRLFHLPPLCYRLSNLNFLDNTRFYPLWRRLSLKSTHCNDCLVPPGASRHWSMYAILLRTPLSTRSDISITQASGLASFIWSFK